MIKIEFKLLFLVGLFFGCNQQGENSHKELSVKDSSVSEIQEPTCIANFKYDNGNVFQYDTLFNYMKSNDESLSESSSLRIYEKLGNDSLFVKYILVRAQSDTMVKSEIVSLMCDELYNRSREGENKEEIMLKIFGPFKSYCITKEMEQKIFACIVD